MIDRAIDGIGLGTWVSARFGVALQTISSPIGMDIGNLVGVALRRNPRRAHLLVSTVLGKHLPVDPNVVVGTGRLLGELVAQQLGTAEHLEHIDKWSDLAGAAIRGADPIPLIGALNEARRDRAVSPVVVLGFAETATSLGHLVADQLRAQCYLHSTRRVVPGVEVAGSFEEGHSHATNHLLLPIPGSLLDADDPLVLVDDELSTGRTAMNTISQAHRRRPRGHYILASLIDLRSDEDETAMQVLAGRLGCRIDVVSLVRGAVALPDGLLEAVAEHISGTDPLPGPATPPAGRRVDPGPVVPIHLPWPADVPDGGRHGFSAADQPAFESSLAQSAGLLAGVLRDRLSQAGSGNQVLVVGTEELMYLPLRLAEHLGRDPALRVGFQSTTRSPVLPVADSGYPVRRQFRFPDAEGDDGTPRFLYNAHGRADARDQLSDPDLVVLVADAAPDPAVLTGPDGPVAVLQAAGLRVELALLGPVDPARLAAARGVPPTAAAGAKPAARPRPALPEPLTGPAFGSYSPDEVRWLLTDLSDLDLEGTVADREAAIQAGTAHYAESLPVEFVPDAAYRELFDHVLKESAERLALAVGRVTELVLRERGTDVVLASLARAGTPIGILMRRWARFRYGLDLPHYALSIVRGRGIDPVALQYLAEHHAPYQVVFVDGWTGKGAIAKELTAALADVRSSSSLEFNDELAVLSDPGHCVRTFGTRDDFLIASACLNSTVSGLVSRTVLNAAYLRSGQFHGAKFYRDLADDDVSGLLLDSVAAAFPAVQDQVMSGLAELAGSDREPTFKGWAAIEAIRAEYGIETVNFVKPGVGETTRVLLRRVPWRILVREAESPDHEHIRMLARQRGVPVEVRADLPYSCVGLIRRMSTSEPGEG